VNKDVYKRAAILLGKVVGLTSARVKGESGRGLTPPVHANSALQVAWCNNPCCQTST